MVYKPAFVQRTLGVAFNYSAVGFRTSICFQCRVILADVED